MKDTKDVTAALICKNDGVFIARRAPGEKMAGGWEFPGGKIEEGETPEECLKRELFEEFGVAAEIRGFFCESIYEYPQGTIRLLAYFADIVSGEIRLTVHDAFRWAAPDELTDYSMLPADIPVARRLADFLRQQHL